MDLYSKIEKYLINLKNKEFKFNDFIEALSHDVVEEFKLDSTENSNKIFIIEQLKNFLLSLLRNKKMLILKDKSDRYIFFDTDEAKIISLFKRFGYPILTQKNCYSLNNKEIVEIFKIYSEVINEEKFKNLVKMKFIEKYYDEFSLVINFDSIFDRKNIIIEELFIIIEKALELEYLKKYLKNISELKKTIDKLDKNISESKKTIDKLNKENKRLNEKYKNSTLYSISTMGIFLAIFSLVSINSTSIYEVMNGGKLISKAGFILVVNGVLLIGLISLVTLIKSLFEVNSDQNIFSKLGGEAIIIPVILCIVGLLLTTL